MKLDKKESIKRKQIEDLDINCSDQGEFAEVSGSWYDFFSDPSDATNCDQITNDNECLEGDSNCDNCIVKNNSENIICMDNDDDDEGELPCINSSNKCTR